MASKVSGKALIEFWQSPLVESRVSARAAADLATACREVLGATEDGLNLNLRTCPVDELLNTYAKARPGTRAQTLAAYKSRFKRAVRLYLAYLDGESWEGEPVTSEPIKAAEQSDPSLQKYHFPLRRDLTLNVILPPDLSVGEARRLGLFIESLVVS